MMEPRCGDPDAAASCGPDQIWIRAGEMRDDRDGAGAGGRGCQGFRSSVYHEPHHARHAVRTCEM